MGKFDRDGGRNRGGGGGGIRESVTAANKTPLGRPTFGSKSPGAGGGQKVSLLKPSYLQGAPQLQQRESSSSSSSSASSSHHNPPHSFSSFSSSSSSSYGGSGGGYNKNNNGNNNSSNSASSQNQGQGQSKFNKNNSFYASFNEFYNNSASGSGNSSSSNSYSQNQYQQQQQHTSSSYGSEANSYQNYGGGGGYSHDNYSSASQYAASSASSTSSSSASSSMPMSLMSMGSIGSGGMKRDYNSSLGGGNNNNNTNTNKTTTVATLGHNYGSSSSSSYGTYDSGNKSSSTSGGTTSTSDDANSERKRKRRSRWMGEDDEKAVIPGMPTILPSGLPEDQQESYIAQLQVEEITRKLRSGDLGIPPLPENRSPSPEPIYGAEGKRMNTREYRTRKKLEEERHKLIARLRELNPEYKPPSDYRQPVVKIVDRVSIPQEEFPDINFVGLLIGPRGNTLKGLEKDSGAKIIIRGKGSVKEGKVGGKAGHPLPGEDEPLHAYVTSNNPEAVKKACEKIKEIIRAGIEQPESQNDLRKTQLRELALLNGTLREGEGPKCSNCGATSHRTWNCPDKPNVTTSVVCTVCGGAGHIGKDCRLKRPGSSCPPTGAAFNYQEKAKIDEEYMSLMAELGEKSSAKDHEGPQRIMRHRPAAAGPSLFDKPTIKAIAAPPPSITASLGQSSQQSKQNSNQSQQQQQHQKQRPASSQHGHSQQPSSVSMPPLPPSFSAPPPPPAGGFSYPPPFRGGWSSYGSPPPPPPPGYGSPWGVPPPPPPS